MVTTAEGMRLAQEGFATLGKGMTALGTHKRLAKGASDILEEDPSEFVGGEGGQKQSAAMMRQGEMAGSVNLRKAEKKQMTPSQLMASLYEQGKVKEAHEVAALIKSTKAQVGSFWPKDVPVSRSRNFQATAGNMNVLLDKGQTFDTSSLKIVTGKEGGESSAVSFLRALSPSAGYLAGGPEEKGVAVTKVGGDPWQDSYGRLMAAIAANDEDARLAELEKQDAYIDSIIVNDWGPKALAHIKEFSHDDYKYAANQIQAVLNTGGMFDVVGGRIQARKIEVKTSSQAAYLIKSMMRIKGGGGPADFYSNKKEIGTGSVKGVGGYRYDVDSGKMIPQ